MYANINTSVCVCASVYSVCVLVYGIAELVQQQLNYRITIRLIRFRTENFSNRISWPSGNWETPTWDMCTWIGLFQPSVPFPSHHQKQHATNPPSRGRGITDTGNTRRQRHEAPQTLILHNSIKLAPFHNAIYKIISIYHSITIYYRATPSRWLGPYSVSRFLFVFIIFVYK